VNRDLSGFRGGWNLYEYVMNNPVRWGDPRGLKPSLTPFFQGAPSPLSPPPPNPTGPVNPPAPAPTNPAPSDADPGPIPWWPSAVNPVTVAIGLFFLSAQPTACQADDEVNDNSPSNFKQTPPSRSVSKRCKRLHEKCNHEGWPYPWPDGSCWQCLRICLRTEVWPVDKCPDPTGRYRCHDIHLTNGM
jgi:hypothetical protein